jgi:translation initiation factor 2B subunit (eIF-2B alpha/beta/delta family)
MTEEIAREVAGIAADRESGASVLTRRAVGVLRRARSLGRDTVRAVAAGLCRAQPSMAPVWIAAGVALADADDGGVRLEAWAHRLERSERAVARAAASLLGEEDGRPTDACLRLATFSASGAVVAAIQRLAAGRDVRVAVAEGRPALEGRGFAAALSASGVRVRFFSDAAIGTGLDAADAVLVGADAVAPGWFINKVGTGAVAALAGARGIPVYVLAGREKFLPPGLADVVTLRAGDPAEIWETPPAGVEVWNPYFERIPLDFIATLVTDAGPIGAALARDVCHANARLIGEAAILQLRQSGHSGPTRSAP